MGLYWRMGNIQKGTWNAAEASRLLGDEGLYCGSRTTESQAVGKSKENGAGFDRIWRNSQGKRVHLIQEEIKLKIVGER